MVQSTRALHPFPKSQLNWSSFQNLWQKIYCRSLNTNTKCGGILSGPCVRPFIRGWSIGPSTIAPTSSSSCKEGGGCIWISNTHTHTQTPPKPHHTLWPAGHKPRQASPPSLSKRKYDFYIKHLNIYLCLFWLIMSSCLWQFFFFWSFRSKKKERKNHLWSLTVCLFSSLHLKIFCKPFFLFIHHY